ncbi:hypothetical protein BLOT_010509 [Blomia tropicalis]|nr:hypothetical protein BLOT_010509 [Blomia tropicalis]
MDTISPAELAKAGFFYFHDDSVQCAFCRGVIRDWNAGDDPMEEHRKHFPKCQFVMGAYCGNMPLEMDVEVNSNKSLIRSIPVKTIIGNYNKSDIPKFPLFNDPSMRNRTYLSPNWKCTIIDPLSLVDAGFFYTGKEDRTRCFHCGGLLFQWNVGEKPLEEHARFFPECHWIRSTRSDTFVEFVQFKEQIIDLRRQQPTSQASMEMDIECMRAMTYENFLQIKQSAYRTMNRLENRNNNSFATTNSKSNTSNSNSSSSSYQRYTNKFTFMIDCQKLFQYLNSMDLIRSPIERTVKSTLTSDDIHSTSFTSTSTDSSNRSSITSNSSIFSFDDNGNINELDVNSDDSDDEQSSKPSNINLKCVLCCEKQIEVVFVPCGHQLACRKCSEKIEHCPICPPTQTNQRDNQTKNDDDSIQLQKKILDVHQQTNEMIFKYSLSLLLFTLGTIFCLDDRDPQQIHLSLGRDQREMVVTWTTYHSIDDASIVQYRPLKTINKSHTNDDEESEHEEEWIESIGQCTLFVDGGDLKRKHFIHRALLSSLEPLTRYEYRCGGTDSKWSAIKTFRTISNRTDWNPRIVLYGDLGLFNGVSIPRLRDEIEQDQVDLILHVGDFAYDMDTNNSYVGDEFMRTMEPIASRVPYQATPGNHENA